MLQLDPEGKTGDSQVHPWSWESETTIASASTQISPVVCERWKR